MADAPLSFIQLMRGVSKVHKGFAESIPGARRIPEEMASKVEKMMPTEVLDEYNKRKMFGQTEKGEPYRGVITRSVTARGETPPGRLPQQGRFRIVPESKARDLETGAPVPPADIASDMKFVRLTPSGADLPLTRSYVQDVDQIKMAGQPDAEVFDINALDVGRGFGPVQYRAMYDMINAGGDVNQAGFLTDINILRRLGNVGPLALSQQGLRGIMPVSESPMVKGGSYSQQLFKHPVMDRSKGHEAQALEHIFGGYDDLIHEAMSMEPKSLRGLDDEALAGLLYTREAQLAKAYGPEARGGMLALDKHLGDKDVLFRLTEPWRSTAGGDTAIGTGIGPHTLGRGRTTEEAIYRMLNLGESPDEIVEDLRRIMGTNVQGFKGRYAKGGLASALEG